MTLRIEEHRVMMTCVDGDGDRLEVEEMYGFPKPTLAFRAEDRLEGVTIVLVRPPEAEEMMTVLSAFLNKHRGEE